MNAEKVAELKVQILQILQPYFPDSLSDLMNEANDMYKFLGLPAGN